MVSSYTLKGISSIFGAFLVQVIQGSTYTWANINTYYVSYLRINGNPEMSHVDGYFIMPLIMTVGMAAGMFGPTIDQVYGIKTCTFLSLVTMWVPHLAFLYSTQIWLLYFAFAVFGFGNGLTFVTVIRNSWMYFPKMKGLVTGIILVGMGGSSLIFTWIADTIINPDHVQIDVTTGFFSKEVSERVYDYLYVLTIIIGVLSIISFITIFDELKQEKEIKPDSQGNTIASANSSTPLSQSLTQSEVIVQSPILQAFQHKQLWQLIVMDFCTLYFAFLSMNTYRSFGQLSGINEGLLSFLSKCVPIINGCSRIIWGVLFDYFSFKTLYFSLLVAEMAISASMFFLGAYPYLYFACICIATTLLAGYIVVLLPLFPRIFDVKYSTPIYGIATAISGMCNFASPMVAKLLVHSFPDYKKLYFSGTLLTLISFITCCCFKETKFRYKEEQEIESGVELEEKKV